MDKKRYDELVELYARLEAAEKLFYLRYGDLKKLDGKFYWKRLIDARRIRDVHRRTISREIPCHWNWAELQPLDCARLFAQGDLQLYSSLSNDDDHDSIGRKVFGNEVWSEASRLVDEDEDGVEWRDLEESTPLIFPEPAPLPCVEDLDDCRGTWFLPSEDDFLAYIKGDKAIDDFQSLVYNPMLGAVGLENDFERVVWRSFPVLEGKGWKDRVGSILESLTQKEESDEGSDVVDGLESTGFENWTPEQMGEILKRYRESDYKFFVYECDDGYHSGIMYEIIEDVVGRATDERYW